MLPQSEDGQWLEDEEQTIVLKTNFVVSAFGSELCDSEGIWSHHA